MNYSPTLLIWGSGLNWNWLKTTVWYFLQTWYSVYRFTLGSAGALILIPNPFTIAWWKFPLSFHLPSQVASTNFRHSPRGPNSDVLNRWPCFLLHRFPVHLPLKLTYAICILPSSVRERSVPVLAGVSYSFLRMITLLPSLSPTLSLLSISLIC